MAILIKRYANRKLYNTDTSRYITLKGIAALLDEGDEVRVIDNETGDDITQVALSQILVDNKRANEDPSDTLLSQILSRGGDALYGAIRKSVDDATEGLGDFQDRFRQMVRQGEENLASARGGLGLGWDKRDGESENDADSGTADSARDHVAMSPDDLDRIVRESVKRAVDSLDLPRRDDLERLSRNFERVATAVERLERAYLPDQQVSTQATRKSS
jgi:polyhydroxyalkanoate synthesis repressor PhaR